jgi:polysaccharide pyruvyl transferase WcaK-like protein
VQLVKLGLVSTSTTRNLGDAATYAALAQLSPERRVHCALRERYPAIVPGLERNRHLDDCDAFISAGGDVFSDARPHRMTKRFIRSLLEIYLRRDRTIIFGQSVPVSCGKLSQRMLGSVFRRLQGVVVRDRGSYEFLKSIGVEAALSHDAAFVLRPRTDALEAAYGLLAHHNLDPDRTALITLRGGSANGSPGGNGGNRELLIIAAKLAGRGHQPAFLMLSGSNAPGSGEADAMHQSSEMDGIPVIDAFAVRPPDAPCDVAIALLSLVNIAVATSYHAAILRLVSGRAPFLLCDETTGGDLRERLALPGQIPGSDADAGLTAGIEDSADAVFDPDPIARDVTDHFMDCIRKLA